MKSTKILLFILLIYLLGFFSHALYLKKTVYGDGGYYYSWLRSMVVDRDIDFTNEYAHLGGSQPVSPAGIPGNKYAIGEALIWAPAFLAIHELSRGDVYKLLFELSVGLTSVLLSFVGIVLLFRLLCRFYNPTISALVAATIAFTSNLLFYGSLDPVNSHGLSFFAAALYVSLLYGQRKRHWYAIGGSLGLLAIIRPQDTIYAALLIPFLSLPMFFQTIIGFVLVFWPQMSAWQLLYQRFWISPYLVGSEGFHFQFTNILNVLFSPQNGLFFWTPITLLAFIGLLVMKTLRGISKKLLIAVVLLQILIVSSWSTWWQGASYSGRMFVSILPIFAFGIASIYKWLESKKWRYEYFLRILIIPLSAMNVIMIITYLLTH